MTATFSGPITVSAGNLVLGSNLGLNVTGAANVTAGTLTVTANSGDSTAGELGNNTAAGAITIAQGATLDASSFTLYKLQPAQRLINGGTFKTGGTLERFGDNTIVVGSDGGAGTFNLTGNLQLTNQFAPSPNTNGLKFDLGNTTTVGGGVNDVLAVSGNISVDSSSGQIPIIVNPLNGALATGTYELMTYGGSLTGSSTDFSISGASSGTTRQSFTIDTSHLGHIDLDVTGAPASLVWKGDGSGNSWDVVTTPNWKNGAANDNFFNFDQVTFNDTTANTTVNLNATVIPGSISVNTAQTYLVQGSGTITGGATLTKSGTGTFILANTGTNDFNGAITINAGTLQIGNGGTDGSIGASSIANSGALVVNKSVAVTLPNAISGTGALVLNGTGGLVLNTNNTYTGPTLVQVGRLQVGSANALGDATGGTTVTASGAEIALFSPLTINEPLTINGIGLDAGGGALHAGGSVVSTWAGPITLGSDATIKVDGNGGGIILTNTVTGTNTNLDARR